MHPAHPEFRSRARNQPRIDDAEPLSTYIRLEPAGGQWCWFEWSHATAQCLLRNRT